MAAAAYGSPLASNLTGGLLSDVMQGLVPGYSGGGLLDSNPQGAQPQPARAAPQPSADSAPAPSAPADASRAAPQPSDADQIQQLIARNRPGHLQTLLHAWGTGQDFNSAQADLTKRNVAAALLPQTIAMQQQRIQYGQSIKDPVMRDLFFNDPQTYGKVMAERMGVHDTAAGATTTGLGAEGNGVVFGSQVLKPGETLSNAGGANLGGIPQAPFTVGAGDSVFVPGRGFVTAPQKPMLVTTKPGETSDIFYPSLPGAGSSIGAPESTQGSAATGGVAPNSAGASRGVRNNNPWNVTPLQKGQWAGQTGTDGDFAQFSTPQAGAQAADRNLQNYARLHGINTVAGIVSRWAPNWQAETPTYVHDVSAALGVTPDQPLDIATNSQTRANVLHAMLPIESGRAGAKQVQAGGVGGQGAASAPAPRQGGASNVQTIRQGATPRDVPAEEAIAKGLAPGKWQQLPDGTYKQSSAPPKDDLDKVARLRGAAKSMDELANADDRFLDAAGRTRPSPWLAGGEHILQNPYAWYMEHNNPDVSQMESLHNQEIFLMKPDNAGQRIMATEIPIWGSSTVDPSKSLEANQGIVRDHQEARTYMQKKAEFYENWLYGNGTLHGADQAWLKVAPKHREVSSGGSAPQVARGPQLPPRAPALPQAPNKVLVFNPQTGALQ